jgi:tRNA dimethylallyltransferase
MGKVKDLIKRNTRRYAKRQITFFKSIPGVKWYHPDDFDGLSREIDSFYAQEASATNVP